MIREGTDHNRSFGVLIVGLFSLTESEFCTVKRAGDKHTCSRRSMSWLSVTLLLSCPVWAILKSIVSICLDRSGLTREIRATDVNGSASSQLVAYNFIMAHVALGHQHPAK